MNGIHDLQTALRRLIESVDPTRYGFSSDIPLAEELRLLDALRQAHPLAPADLLSLGPSGGDWLEGHLIRMFVVRMAVHAVRINNPEPLATALPLLAVDERADFRDILADLAMIGECGRRLGLDVGALYRSLAEVAGPRRRDTILNGYLRGGPSGPGPQVYGYAPSGTGEAFTFVRTE